MIELFLQNSLAFAQLFKISIWFGKLVGDGIELGQEVNGLLDPLLDHFAHGLAAVDQRLLLEETDGVPLGEDGLAVELLVDAGHDPEQGRLARAVEAQNADLGAVEVGEGDVLDDRLLVVVLADADHRVDDLLGIFTHCEAPDKCRADGRL